MATQLSEPLVPPAAQLVAVTRVLGFVGGCLCLVDAFFQVAPHVFDATVDSVDFVVSVLLDTDVVLPVSYPDLLPRDALAMGAVQAAAVLAPTAYSGVFPKALLAWALAYLALAPRFYWRPEGKRS